MVLRHQYVQLLDLLLFTLIHVLVLVLAPLLVLALLLIIVLLLVLVSSLFLLSSLSFSPSCPSSLECQANNLGIWAINPLPVVLLCTFIDRFKTTYKECKKGIYYDILNCAIIDFITPP